MPQNKRLSFWIPAAMFPAVLVYYEVIFRVSTAPDFPVAGTLFLLLFSAVYGGLGYLLCTLPRRPAFRYGLTLFWLVLSAAPFLIQYFIYFQFNIFYDLNTCFNGAADALSDFTQEIYHMVFSFDGMTRILLFLLPTVVFAVFGRKFLPEKPALKLQVLLLAALAAVFALSSFAMSRTPGLSLLTGQEYHFQGAVTNLGLLTGLRLDVPQLFAPEEPEAFEAVTAVLPVVTEPAEVSAPSDEQTAVPEEEPVVYTPNVMELDFDAVDNRGNLGSLNAYVQAQTPSMKNPYTGLFEGKNLIFITAEAFTAEAIDPELTPTLYRMATKGIQFTDYYQPASAGTTGGEFQNVFGMPPAKGGASFRLTQRQQNYFTMGSQLDRLGYYGVAYHNHSCTYYDRNLTHNNIGYSEGFIGEGNGLEAHLSSGWPKSDLEMFTATVPTYIDKQPFNIYYMTFSGHCGYLPEQNAMVQRHWDRVAHLECSNLIKGYLASQLELEDSMAYLLEQLEEAGIADDTVVCISTDHFPYGLDNGNWGGKNSNLTELYGFQARNYLERDHSRLILWCGSLEDQEPIVVDTPTCSSDILPTLSNLFGTEFDSRLMVGRDVFSDAPALVFNVFYDWKTEYGTYISGENTFYPADESIQLPDGYVETVKTIVRNKIRYCKWVLETDYFRHLFPDA